MPDRGMQSPATERDAGDDGIPRNAARVRDLAW